MPSLNWIGKKDIKNHHNHVEYRVIDCKESIGDLESGNLIVKGDNLLALKSLLPYYAGKVKMIYIDPPYNTGNTKWVYNDNVDSSVIKKWLEKTIDKDDLSRSDKWLCMIYPRMKLLHQFLEEEGMIYISLDDAEVFHMKLLMDEIFGKKNYVATLTWRGMHTVRNSSKEFNKNTEYVLVYAKDKTKLIKAGDPTTYLRYIVDKTNSYPLNDNDGRGRYKLDPIYARNEAALYEYTFINGVVWSAPRGNYPRYSLDSLDKMDRKGDIVFTGREPKAKRFLKDVQEGVPPDTLLKKELVGFNKNGTDQLYKIFNEKVFNQPKPTELIKYLMKIQREADNNANDYIVMDSFAGSGTTGQAVLEQNQEDGGTRKFILIEMEDYAENTTKERVRRAVEGYSYTGKMKTNLIEPIKLKINNILNSEYMTTLQSEVEQVLENNSEEYDKIEKSFKENILKIVGIKDIAERAEGLGGGFQYCELSEPLLDDFGLLSDHVTFDMLAKHIYFTEFGIALTQNQISEENNYAGKFKETELFLYVDKKFNLSELDKLLEKESEKYLVFADTWSITPDLLSQHNIEVKRLPLEIRGT